MMKAALLLLLVLAAALAQFNSTEIPVCKENETFKTCGTACEPSCDVPDSIGCTFQCVVGCQCDEGFFRRSDKACVTKDQCEVARNKRAPVAAILFYGPRKDFSRGICYNDYCRCLPRFFCYNSKECACENDCDLLKRK